MLNLRKHKQNNLTKQRRQMIYEIYTGKQL